jgi:hypothetical protein
MEPRRLPTNADVAGVIMIFSSTSRQYRNADRFVLHPMAGASGLNDDLLALLLILGWRRILRAHLVGIKSDADRASADPERCCHEKRNARFACFGAGLRLAPRQRLVHAGRRCEVLWH